RGRNADHSVLSVEFEGSRSQACLEGLDPQRGKSNYLIGPPSAWRTNVRHFRRVRQRDAYPGIDVVYYTKHGRLEFDVVVSPGADPAMFRLNLKGARSVRVGSNGELLVALSTGEMRLLPPSV